MKPGAARPHPEGNGMTEYLLRRLLLSLLVLIGVSIVTFLILHLVPGDPVYAILGRQAVSAEDQEQLREQLGLNEPLPAQYLNFVGNVLRGNLGRSIRSNRDVTAMIGEQLPNTIVLTAVAITIAVGVGFTVGLIAALQRDTWIDHVFMLVIIAGVSVPSFWLGLLLILLFSVTLGWLPAVASAGDPRGIVLPALALGLGEAAVIARMVRANMLEVLNQPYQTVARSKGLRERRVVLRHALPNALIPIISLIGLQFGLLLSGSVVIETLFARPGLGRLTVTAINNRDFPLVQGIALIIAVIYVSINTLTDLLSALINPRIRLR
jgi:ABC-type dipeptide/oligopeptide/nickel transport system permease component